MRTVRWAALAILIVGASHALEIQFRDHTQVVLPRGGTATLDWWCTDADAVVTITAGTFTGTAQTHKNSDDPATGTVAISVPANEPYATCTLTLQAKVGSTIKTDTRQLRINRPPVLSAGGTSTTTEDGSGSLVITCTDDRPTSYELSGRIVSTSDKFTSATTTQVAYNQIRISFVTAPDAFTATGTTTPITVRVSDQDGGYADIPLSITITPTNDPPELRMAAGKSAELVLMSDQTASAAIGADVEVVEVRDSLGLASPVATTLAANNKYIRWRLTMPQGIDGGDLLSLAVPDATWRLNYDSNLKQQQIQAKSGTTWTTVATWERGDGQTVSNRSDRLVIAMAKSTTMAQATAVLGMVRYAWLLGVPPRGSPLAEAHAIELRIDEPDAAVAGGYAGSPALVRSVRLRAANRAPLASAPDLSCPPLGEVELALSVVDDDDSSAWIAVTTPPRAGAFCRRDDPQHHPIDRFTLAEVRAHAIAYRHRTADMVADTAGLLVHDDDPASAGNPANYRDRTAACQVAIAIAAPKPRLAVLGDPLLEVRQPEGTTTWPLHFTHAVSTVELGDYPGMGPHPAGISAVNDPEQGWRLVFDWTAIDRSTGFVAVVLSATTTDASLDPSKRSASQALLIRVPVGPASGAARRDG